MPPASRRLGWAGPGAPDRKDHIYAASSGTLIALPPKVQLTVPTLGPLFDPALNQGDLGRCGPTSAAAHLLLIMEKATGETIMPSALFIYYATRLIMGTTGYDSGVYNRDMLKALNKHGWCSQELWPDVNSRFKTKPTQVAWDDAGKRKITEYLSVPQTLNSMKSNLAEGYPIIFGFSVFPSIFDEDTEATGVIKMPGANESTIGGHDVLLTGFDDVSQTFDLRNSWGEWGNQGNGSIPYGYALSPNMAGDFWTIRKAGWAPPTPPVPAGPRITVTSGFTLAPGVYQLLADGRLIPSSEGDVLTGGKPEPEPTSKRRTKKS